MKYFLLWLCTHLTLFSCAQQSSIDKADLKRHIQVLSADSLEGRGVGTPGHRKAEKYIANTFNNVGLLPAYPEYRQTFTLLQRQTGEVYIKTPHKTFKNFDNIIFQVGEFEDSVVQKEIIFAGYGSSEDLDQLNIENKLVLIFTNNQRAFYTINIELKKRKAYGVILIDPDDDLQFESIKSSFRDHALGKTFSLPETDTLALPAWDTVRFINTFYLPRTEVKPLTGYSVRKLKSLTASSKLREVPTTTVDVKLQQNIIPIETTNVIGMLKGESDKTIAITAHYDHLGMTSSEIFHGADDNASGVAALIEIAEELSNDHLSFNVMFIATTAEEGGLLGSSYFVNERNVTRDNFVCNVNLDMVGRTDSKHKNEGYLYCLGTGQSELLDSLIREADDRSENCRIDYSMNETGNRSGLFSRSDHYNFYLKGIPAVHFFSGLHADYHKPSDTSSKINYDLLEKRVKLVAEVIRELQKISTKDP